MSRGPRHGIAVAFLLVALTACDSPETANPSPTNPRPVLLPAFGELPPPPRTMLRQQTVALAGEHVVVIGGDAGFAGAQRAARRAAVYSMRSHAWRRLVQPFDEPLVRPGAVWAGEELIVAGTPCDEPYPAEDAYPFCAGRRTRAASLRPGDGTWNDLRDPPLPRVSRRGQPAFLQGLGWTGRHAVFQEVGLEPRYLFYEPRTDRWTTVPNSVPLNDGRACVAGTHLYAVREQKSPETSNALVTGSSAVATISTSKYELATRSWRRLADQPGPPGGDVTSHLTCQDEEMALLPGFRANIPRSEGVLWFDPATDAWEPVPVVPAPFLRAAPARAGSTRALWPIETSRHYFLLEDGATSWTPVEKPTHIDTDVVSSHGRLLVRRGETTEQLAFVDLVRYAREHGTSGVPVPPG